MDKYLLTKEKSVQTYASLKINKTLYYAHYDKIENDENIIMYTYKIVKITLQIHDITVDNSLFIVSVV